MLTNTERATALKIMVAISDPKDCAAIDDQLCVQYPAIETEDLESLWREAGNRMKAEAQELRRLVQLRRQTANQH